MTSIPELLENETSLALLVQLLTKFGRQVRVRLESPQNVECTLIGVPRRVSLPMNGSEEFMLLGATVQPQMLHRHSRYETRIMLRLAPIQPEEFKYIDLIAWTQSGGHSFGLVDERGDTVLGFGLLDQLITLLLSYQAMPDKKYTWGDVVENAVTRNKKQEDAQQLQAHSDFGSW